MELPSSFVKKQQTTRPLLKWAGGKTQLLEHLIPKIPKTFNKYIEPFIGGGALFFNLTPDNGIIADSNPELINFYEIVANDVDELIDLLITYKNKENFFYSMRSKDWTKLTSVEAAARTLFLNRTCFNGLYRVNRKGQFNVPFGHYKSPKIVDEESLYSASSLLRKTKIICGDYKDILFQHAKPGDFIFLDPPYLPVSVYSDFKRYTKEQFFEEDHVELAIEVNRLHELGCNVLVTNSNHKLVHELYGKFKIEVIKTKRNISCRSKGRQGEDVIVTIPPKQRFNLRVVQAPLPEQALRYPSTRYMGSKSKLLVDIWAVSSQFQFDKVVDLFSGTGVVGYMFKSHGKSVISNDYMAMSSIFAKAMIENNKVILTLDEAEQLLEPPRKSVDRFVEKTFKGLYFSDDENRLIDVLRFNIKQIKNPYKHAIAMSALIRACVKKRPRGIFTYIGHRYDDGRRDLLLSLGDQFLEAVDVVNGAVFDNGQKNKARHGDAMTLEAKDYGLVYIDPPYYSQYSDNEYVRRYHFVEGIARDWKGIEIQEHTITKKFKSYPTPFSTRNGAAAAFDLLFKKFRKSILLVSYSSNSQPTQDEMVAILAKYKDNVEVFPISHTYSFGNQRHKMGNNKNEVKEYLFVGF